MLSFHKKYLIQKCLTGTALIIFGCADVLFPTSCSWLFYLLLALYAVGMIWSMTRKAEPEDERAVDNIRKTKSHLYNLLLLLIVVNEVFARWDGKTLELTGNMILILLGLLQFGEYFHFLRFEKGDADE